MQTQDISSIPQVIIQDVSTRDIIMIGYMNIHAYSQTLQSNKIVLFDIDNLQTYVVGNHCGHELYVQHFFVNSKQTQIIIQVILSGTCGKCNPHPFQKTELSS